jgi:NADPH:quinone reductase
MTQKIQAIRVHQTGGPEVLRLEESAITAPGAGEVLVQVKAAGVNFIDIYIRSGLYSRPLPFTLGLEGAGVVVETGPGVSHLRAGDRVAWTDVFGSYATHVIAKAERLVALPDALTFEQGAAAMLQGLTAHYLTQSTYPLKKGDTCLVHAAAGGVGLLLCQIGNMLGARVIGTASTPEKAQLAKAAGADDIIIYTTQNVADEINNLTAGQGVNVVYDSVGKDTFEGSVNSLARRGYLVSFGQASGAIPPIELQKLSPKSLFLTRPSLSNYVVTREELLQRANDVFTWISSGKLNLRIEHIYALADAAEAHLALAGRKTTGKILLIPNS